MAAITELTILINKKSILNVFGCGLVFEIVWNKMHKHDNKSALKYVNWRRSKQ
jgi:hypothetical protein